MKGSVGSVSVASRGASGGAIGSKGVGMSLSPEARSFSSGSKFSSRGLSRFNASPISFKDIGGAKAPSLINLNKGREASRVFDMARPVRADPVTPFKAIDAPHIIDMQHGKGKTSIVARTKSLEPTNIFDLARKPAKDAPVFTKPRPVFSESVRGVQKTVNIETKVISKPRMEARVIRPEILNLVSRSSPLTGETRAVQKTEVPKHAIGAVLEQAVRVRADASPLMRRAVELDVVQAVKTATVIAWASNIPEPEAEGEVLKVLAKKYEGKPGVEVAMKAEQRVKTAVKSGEPEKNKSPNAAKPFYFDEDARAQKEREDLAVREAELLLTYKKPEEGVVTGKDVAARLTNPGEKAMSEVSLGYGKDGSYEMFREEISKTEEVEDVNFIRTVAKRAAKLFKAVKLSAAISGATREHAEVVYGSILHNKPANFGPQGHGKFREDSSAKLWYIPQNQGKPAEVA